MKDWKFLKGFLLGVFLAAGAGSAWLYSQEHVSLENIQDAAPDSREAKAKVRVLEEIIETQYLEEIEQSHLTENMYAGMIEGLEDPYSRYYTSDEYKTLSEETDGAYEGIGIVMQKDPDTGVISVIRCYENAPGVEAGILPGDILYKVNDQEVTDMELQEVANLIKRSESAVSRIVIVRENEPDYLEFDVKRRRIEIPSVVYEMLDNQIGYLCIYEFADTTTLQYQEAYDALNAQGMEKLVVDLRGNPGGLLSSVCSILETILPEGLIVYTEDKDKNKEEYTCPGETPITIELAVLINGNSASAAEIFAGAVQDYELGTLVGTTTFGKGIVQTVTQIEDGSAVKLTTAKYYTPNGRNIHGTGIKPDIEVELNEELRQRVSITKEEDNQLQTAIEALNGNS